MLTPEQLDNFRSQLVTAKNELIARFNENGHYGLENGHAHESTGELSSYDNHPGDEATELFEREKDLALNELSEEELHDIDHALKALNEGSYGICEVCGKPISVERLSALPTAVTCKDHSPNQTVSHDRPIEESVLKPPFGQFDFDDRDESVAYDAEDTFQEVAEFGTSESPSDFEYPPERYDDMYIESDEPIGYVEDLENYIGTDISGKNVTVYPSELHEKYESELDEEGIMTEFGDLPAYEKDPYTEDYEKRD
ncbi:TraR/DksA C4-type zinc finger protein [Metabacillus sp. RGM 3146]|uniref:TraR/DksA C4-type zinc finger protein n=1 Tax=Metabacillus sp. RGM 3146 TaxID=3401092 RepID=UPI003B9C8998